MYACGVADAKVLSLPPAARCVRVFQTGRSLGMPCLQRCENSASAAPPREWSKGCLEAHAPGREGLIDRCKSRQQLWTWQALRCQIDGEGMLLRVLFGLDSRGPKPLPQFDVEFSKAPIQTTGSLGPNLGFGFRVLSVPDLYKTQNFSDVCSRLLPDEPFTCSCTYCTFGLVFPMYRYL